MMLTQKRRGKLYQRREKGFQTSNGGLHPLHPAPCRGPAVPVGLPDVQHVRLGDPHGVRLPVQKVEEVLDGVRRFGVGRPPYRSEEVLHKGMQRHLKELKPGGVMMRSEGRRPTSKHLVWGFLSSIAEAEAQLAVVGSHFGSVVSNFSGSLLVLRAVPLALVESSLVRCTSFSFSFFLSGFFLLSSSTSGSIYGKT